MIRRHFFGVVVQLDEGMRFISHQGASRTSKQGFRYTKPEYKVYKRYLSDAFRHQMGSEPPTEKPVIVSLGFYYPAPKRYKSWSGEPNDPKPNGTDLVNLIKGVEDAMEGIVFVNDKQVVGYNDCRKVYHTQGHARSMLDIYVQTLSLPGLGPQ